MALKDIKNPLEASQVSPSSMEVIRVLHIDDDENVQMFLKVFVEGDPNIKVTQIQDAAEAIQLIQTGAYDCFVSDYDMPGMDGVTLAGKVREISNIPIIIYTGRGSEEIAERAFAAGIDDYIRKENAPAHYQLLAKRIRQAVERRRSNESYRNLFDNASDAIYIHTLDGTILDVNEVLCTRLGFLKEDFLGKSLLPFVSPQNISYENNLKRIIKKKHVVFESNHIAKDGRLIPVEVSTRVIKYMGFDAILSFSRDISDRKRLEAQMKERLDALQSHALELGKCEDAITVAKTTYTILHDLMGYSFFGLGIVEGNNLRFIPDTFEDKDGDIVYPIAGSSISAKAVRKGFAINIPDVRLDPDYFKPKSGYRYLSDLAVPIKIGGKVIAVLNVEDERLGRFTSDDEQLLEIFSEHVASALHRIKLLESAKKSLARIEIINRHALRLATLKTVDEVAEYSFTIIDEILGFNDGCIGVVEGDVIKFKYSRNIGFQIPDRPLNGGGITARACRTGESQLVSDTRLDPDFVKDTDPSEYLSELDVPVKIDGRVVAVVNLEDRKPGYFSKEDREVVEVLAENIGSALSRIRQLEIIHASGVALTQSEARFKYLLDSSPEGVTVNTQGRLLYVNQGFADMMGYTIDEVTQKGVLDLTKAEYRELTSEMGRRRQAGEDVESLYEVELIRKDGRFIPVEYSVSRINFNGESASLTFIRDISHVKEKRSLEARMAALHSHAHDLNEQRSEEDVARVTLDILHRHLNCNLLSLRASDGENLNMLARWGAKSIGTPLPIQGKGLMARAARMKKSYLTNDTQADKDYLGGPNDARSELVVPILFKGDLMGVLNAESLESNVFSPADQLLMEAMADEVGSALVRIKALEAERSYNMRLEALSSYAAKLTTCHTLAQVAKITLDTISEITKADFGSFAEIKEGKLIFIYDTGVEKNQRAELELDGPGITVKAAKTGEPQLVQDTSKEADYLRSTNPALVYLSELVVPVKNDEVLAVINLESVKANTFNVDDEKLLTVFAEHVASSITRIRDQEARVKYEHKLEALNKSSTRLSKANTLDEALDSACEILNDFGYNWVGLGRVDEKAIKYVRVLGTGLIGNNEIPLDRRSITSRAVRSGETQLVPDTSKDEDYMVVNPEDTVSGSELVVPIRVNGRVRYVVNVEGIKVNEFSAQDKHLVELLSTHLGSAVELVRKKEKLNSIHLNASFLALSVDIQEIAKNTLATIGDVLDLKISSFHVVNGKAIEMIENTGFTTDHNFIQTLDGSGVIPYAVREARSVYVPDTAQDGRYSRGPTQMGEIRSSEFVVPILIDKVPVAAVNLESEQKDGFSEEDRELVELLSEHVASAINRIKQYDDLKTLGERYKGILDSSFDGMIVFSGLKIVYANQSFARILGFESSDLIGIDASTILPINELELLIQKTPNKSGKPESGKYEFKLLRKDGKSVEIETVVTLTEFNGQPAALAVVKEVSESKRFERQMVALRDHAYRLAETSSIEEICHLTLNAVESVIGFQLGSFLVVEGTDLKSIGNRGSSPLGKPIPIAGAGITAKAARKGVSVLVRDVRDDPDFMQGTTASLSELAVPVVLEGKTIAVLNFESLELGAFTEVDQRLLENFSVHVSSALYRIEQNMATKKSEAKYRNIIDSSLDSVFLLSGTKLLYANKKVAEFLGYDDVSELIGTDLINVIAEDDKEKIRQRALSRMKGELQSDRLEFSLKRRDGSFIEVEAAVTLTEYEGKPAVLSFARDISERKRYQTKLTQLHGSANNLARASTRDEVWDTAIETVSKILGFDFVGIGVVEENYLRYVKSVGDKVPKDWRVDLSKPSISSRTIEMGTPQLVADTRLDPDYIFAPGAVDFGSELASPIIVDGKPIAILNIECLKTYAFSEDDVSLVQILVGQISSAIDRITHGEEERVQREARQRELIEGMERMSGMVRHDLRGPLQTIQSAAYLLRRRPERADELAQRIDDGVEYAVRILEDLRLMSKPGELNRASTNLSDLIEKSLNDVNIPATLVVEKNLVSLNVNVDQYRVRRVVDNLVKNAVEAMPDGGTLRVRLESVGGLALLTVGDSGRGIADDVGRKLFTPFYTTKSSGTGLGLVICKQIVEAHGGRIEFESHMGVGTTFSVTLPLMPNSVPYETKSAAKPSEDSVYLFKKRAPN